MYLRQNTKFFNNYGGRIHKMYLRQNRKQRMQGFAFLTENEIHFTKILQPRLLSKKG